LKEEMNELKANNLRYWAQSKHSSLEKSAHALRRDRLLLIKEKFSDLKRAG
jgi:hypothetical protein